MLPIRLPSFERRAPTGVTSSLSEAEFGLYLSALMPSRDPSATPTVGHLSMSSNYTSPTSSLSEASTPPTSPASSTCDTFDEPSLNTDYHSVAGFHNEDGVGYDEATESTSAAPFDVASVFDTATPTVRLPSRRTRVKKHRDWHSRTLSSPKAPAATSKGDFSINNVLYSAADIMTSKSTMRPVVHLPTDQQRLAFEQLDDAASLLHTVTPTDQQHLAFEQLDDAASLFHTVTPTVRLPYARTHASENRRNRYSHVLCSPKAPEVTSKGDFSINNLLYSPTDVMTSKSTMMPVVYLPTDQQHLIVENLEIVSKEHLRDDDLDVHAEPRVRLPKDSTTVHQPCAQLQPVSTQRTKHIVYSSSPDSACPPETTSKEMFFINDLLVAPIDSTQPLSLESPCANQVKDTPDFVHSPEHLLIPFDTQAVLGEMSAVNSATADDEVAYIHRSPLKEDGAVGIDLETIANSCKGVISDNLINTEQIGFESDQNVSEEYGAWDSDIRDENQVGAEQSVSETSNEDILKTPTDHSCNTDPTAAHDTEKSMAEFRESLYKRRERTLIRHAMGERPKTLFTYPDTSKGLMDAAIYLWEARGRTLKFCYTTCQWEVFPEIEPTLGAYRAWNAPHATIARPSFEDELPAYILKAAHRPLRVVPEQDDDEGSVHEGGPEDDELEEEEGEDGWDEEEWWNEDEVIAEEISEDVVMAIDEEEVGQTEPVDVREQKSTISWFWGRQDGISSNHRVNEWTQSKYHENRLGRKNFSVRFGSSLHNVLTTEDSSDGAIELPPKITDHQSKLRAISFLCANELATDHEEVLRPGSPHPYSRQGSITPDMFALSSLSPGQLWSELDDDDEEGWIFDTPSALTAIEKGVEDELEEQPSPTTSKVLMQAEVQPPSLKQVEASKILGVSPDATHRDTRRAYLRCALNLHPDKNASQPEHFTTKFVQLKEAFDILAEGVSPSASPKLLEGAPTLISRPANVDTIVPEMDGLAIRLIQLAGMKRYLTTSYSQPGIQVQSELNLSSICGGQETIARIAASAKASAQATRYPQRRLSASPGPRTRVDSRITLDQKPSADGRKGMESFANGHTRCHGLHSVSPTLFHANTQPPRQSDTRMALFEPTRASNESSTNDMAEKTTRRLKLHLEEAKTGSSKDEGTASLATPTLYDVCCNNPTGVVIVGVVGYIVGSFLWKF